MVVEVLLSLGRLLVPSDPSLEERLRLAIEKPAAYLEKHPETGERLSMSPDPAADPALPWLALVDGLVERGFAVELDHRVSGEEASASLERLTGSARLSARTCTWMAALGPEGMATIDCLRRIAVHAAGDGVVIAVLDIDSDSYVVLLLAKDDYERATRLAEKLGFILKDIREHDPNA